MHHIFLDTYVDIYVTHNIYVTYMLFFICDIYDCSVWGALQASPVHGFGVKSRPQKHFVIFWDKEMSGSNNFGSFCGNRNVHLKFLNKMGVDQFRQHYVRGAIDAVGVTCRYDTSLRARHKFGGGQLAPQLRAMGCPNKLSVQPAESWGLVLNVNISTSDTRTSWTAVHCSFYVVYVSPIQLLGCHNYRNKRLSCKSKFTAQHRPYCTWRRWRRR